jgi:hypothetical protein
VGKHLSPVQIKALMILNFLEDIRKAEEDIVALKRAYLSSGLAEPSKLFPEAFRKAPETVVMPDDPDDEPADAHYDYSEVKWKSGSEAYGEYARLMALVGGGQNGTISGDMVTEAPPAWTDWS